MRVGVYTHVHAEVCVWGIHLAGGKINHYKCGFPVGICARAQT